MDTPLSIRLVTVLRPRLLLTAHALLLVAACGAEEISQREIDAVPDSARYGGTAVLALSSDPATLNGLAAVDFVSMWIHQGLLSMPLIRYDQQMRPQPWLAERWDTVRFAGDSLLLTVRLRRDVRWHDGIPTTAEDVRFTYERMHDPVVGFPRLGFLADWSPRVEVLDSFTVRFRLRAHAEFLDFWTWDVPLPAHLLRGVPPEKLRDHPFSHSPIGNGPFRFVRRIRGQELVFEANPDFPAAVGGRPYLDRIVFRVIPDPTARLTELLTGGIDLAGLPAEHVERMRRTRGYQVLDHPTWAWTQLAWNTRRAPFDDPRVRGGLTKAIDRRALVDGVLFGLGEPGRWTVTPSHWQFDDSDATAPRHDPEGARRLLAEAGWEDRDGDGVLENAAGVPLRFTIHTFRESSAQAHAATVLQAQWRAIGADARIRLLEEGSLMALVEGRRDALGERVRDFDVFLTNWENGPRSDDSWFLHSRHRNDPLAVAGFSSPAADMLMETLTISLDREAALPLWHDYQRRMIEEAPVTVLYYARGSVGVAERLQSVEVDARGPYLGTAGWWLLPGKRR
jgi:peptide/nickel transport system substrate-binding protein